MKQKAFTLIELSIVLVIIGLIVGGVLVGKDLIEAAQMRSLITQVEQFNTAVNTFKSKYNCLPGDCANATNFFPADTNCVAWGSTPTSFRDYIAAPNGQTCKGDGNGLIYGPSTAYGEEYLFWQHLSLAGLVEGDLTGASAKPATNYIGVRYFAGGLNTPKTKLKDSMFVLFYPAREASWWVGLNASHYFWFGAPGSNAIWEAWAQPALTSPQARSLDLKVDDGLPGTGSLQSDQRNIGCYSGNYAGNSYNGSSSLLCSLLFRASF